MSALPAPNPSSDSPVTKHGLTHRPATSRRSQDKPATRRWHNHLPGWILDDPAYQRLRGQFKRTLQAIANKGDLHEDGSLYPCFGGADLISQAGCSRSKFWAHLKRLEELGFVVTLNRGGQIGRRNLGNVYGVPGTKGGLDSRRCAREMRLMRLGEDGRRRPVVITPGAQATIWEHTERPVRLESGTTPGPKWDDPRPEVGRPPSRNGTTPVPKRDTHTSPVKSPSESPFEQSHDHDAGFLGVKVRGERPTGRQRLRHSCLADLEDTDRLIELYEDSVQRCLVPNSKDGMIRFVSAAEHALRCGENPVRLFAAIVNADKWYLSQGDEANAIARLNRHYDRGGDPRQRKRTPACYDPHPCPSAKPRPSPNTPEGDADLVARLFAAFRDKNRRMPRWNDTLRDELVAHTETAWDLPRYAAARDAALKLMGVEDET